MGIFEEVVNYVAKSSILLLEVSILASCYVALEISSVPAAEVARHLGVATSSITRAVEKLDDVR